MTTTPLHHPTVVEVAHAEGETYQVIRNAAAILGKSTESIVQCLLTASELQRPSAHPVKLEAVHRAAPVLHDTEWAGERYWLAEDPHRHIFVLYRPSRG